MEKVKGHPEIPNIAGTKNPDFGVVALDEHDIDDSDAGDMFFSVEENVFQYLQNIWTA